MDINLELSDYVGVSEKYGRRSVIIAQAVVTLGNGMALDCPIWATLQTDKDTKEQSVVIEPGLPRNVRFTDTDQGDAFKASIMDAAADWSLYANLEAKAIARLTNTKIAAPKGKLVRKIEAAKVEAVEPTAETTNVE